MVPSVAGMRAVPGLGRRPRRRTLPEPTDGVSDEALVAAMAAGDAMAAAALVRRCQRRVFGIALAITGDRSVAEDVAQETFLRVWRHATVFDAHRASARTWISSIARNLAIDVVRSRRAVPVDPLLGLAERDGPDDEVTAEERAVASSLVGDVRRAVEALPAEQRRALMRAAFYGQTAAEVSVAEHIPLGTAKSRIRLALAKVRTTVAAEREESGGPDA